MKFSFQETLGIKFPQQDIETAYGKFMEGFVPKARVAAYVSYLVLSIVALIHLYTKDQPSSDLPFRISFILLPIALLLLKKQIPIVYEYGCLIVAYGSFFLTFKRVSEFSESSWVMGYSVTIGFVEAFFILTLRHNYLKILVTLYMFALKM